MEGRLRARPGVVHNRVEVAAVAKSGRRVRRVRRAEMAVQGYFYDERIAIVNHRLFIVPPVDQEIQVRRAEMAFCCQGHHPNRLAKSVLLDLLV